MNFIALNHSARQPNRRALGAALALLATLSAVGATTETNDPISLIRDEGLNRSQVMQTLSHLTEVIGPRLTGSPNLKRANEWTRDQFSCWGLTNAHLEPWGPFGRGWTLKRFSAQVIEPQTISLIGYPNAWSPGFPTQLVAEVVHVDLRTNGDYGQYEGKLRGAIVLSGPKRDLKPPFEPFALRLVETNLLRLANAGERTSSSYLGAFTQERRRTDAGGGTSEPALSGTNRNRAGTSEDRSGPRGGRGLRPPPNRALSFLAKEGAALVISPSTIGEGGAFFVAGASVPTPYTRGTNATASTNLIRAWSTNAPAIPPQVTLAAEDYNRLVRMLDQEQKLKMAVDLQVEFHDEDPMAYNTIAELPGTDLKNELVMVGAHLDSWHSGTGATDNGAGVAATMEAVRILSALQLHPRRTIRIALWSGEEQGLLGSKAYVAAHFGYYTNGTDSGSGAVRAPKDGGQTRGLARSTNSAGRKLVRGREYEKLSAYFNLDNGAGKIRGIYLQGNETVRPLFRQWIDPFADLGAETITLANTSGTDHLSFDAIGLPGFEFMQDPLDYRSRTHHSNQDLFDRVPPDDLKQAATIIAAFLYDAAMADDKVPRKAISAVQ
ncbi:MAG TPA: M20/M25/M40 family metallo-hydrolase [Methylomirabilota bacterium]|nr:M20/M25/M40 family metallo-hydrolase [Methylomirabilota bacterium]